jgi:DNA-binding SARP family transcriptional activator
VYARIAEILEADHPDQAVAALERAAELDPVNEELYQRIMRIHGRQHRPDAVRRTLRRLEERLAELGGAEPSQATRRVAERQLRPAAPVSGGQR